MGDVETRSEVNKENGRCFRHVLLITSQQVEVAESSYYDSSPDSLCSVVEGTDDPCEWWDAVTGNDEDGSILTTFFHKRYGIALQLYHVRLV